jgi:anaerobic magnesium-protoporphyrin IX monomethyl ester cyclase
MSKFGQAASGKGDPLLNRERDTGRPILLIGFLQQENLGLGYLSAMLRRYGYNVIVLDFEAEPGEILRVARACDPLIIGLSLIFQFYLPRFARLARTLRDGGIGCHLTIGGHFPTLSYDETIQHIPELDSVVRFEGEETLLELADVLSMGGDFRGVSGLAYAATDGVVCNSLRALVHDLDHLPYPDRRYQKCAILGRNSTYMLASRGCIRTCSFCSIHMFYRSAPGKVVRLRTPQNVVEEMAMLYEKHDITLFLFQDDDFPVYGVKWRLWAKEFCEELRRVGLADRVLWKISCRADAVDADLFALMRDSGLYLVYMGLESGNAEGLKSLNKRITVEQNIQAVETLKRLGIRFEFGFMLFEPSTTFASVREDVQFLRHIVGDGSTAAAFCRMVPYDGTPIKDELIKAGRLRGDVCNPYYDFLDPKLGEFCYALGRVLQVTGWIHGLESVSQALNFAWIELAVTERLFPRLPGIVDYRATLQQITRTSNLLLFEVVEDIANFHENGQTHHWSAEALRERCRGFLKSFVSERDAFVYRNRDTLLEGLRVPASQSLEPALS